MTSLTAGFGAVAERGPGPETPGICGISVLKRSDGGWSVMWLRIDSILKEEKVDSPAKIGICDRRVVGDPVAKHLGCVSPRSKFHSRHALLPR